MAYSYKQWTADQTADNVIHASDLERWQDGITEAGGTWSGSWTDEKDTLTAEQLNVLETEIASLYGTGFTAKTWEDGQVPGVDEWNRIEDAINTILNRTAFAIYCETDNSLTFYVDYPVPSAGETYNGKTVTNVYTGFTDRIYTGRGNQPWADQREDIVTVEFNSSFKSVQSISLAYWFTGFTKLTAIKNLANIDTGNVTSLFCTFNECSALETLDLSSFDTSNVTTMQSLFNGCSSLTSLDLSSFDTSNVTNISSMFYGCSSLTSLDLSSFDTSNVTNISSMFYGCSSLTSLDLSSFDTSNVTTMQYMFRTCSLVTTIYAADDQFKVENVTSDTGMFMNCSSLVGGNGTTFSSAQQTSAMAHIDTEDNPGYFTAK